MRHLNAFKCGLALGLVTALWHLAWVALVAFGAARPVLDFVLKLHFVEMNYALAPCNAAIAAELIGLTFGVGFLVGLLFAGVWNWLAVASVSAIDRPAAAD